MRVHFIAMGGAIMHNLAIALHKKGFHVTGSDDEIFEPSKSRLASYGLLPVKNGWFPERITGDIEVVILGMHARADNPELIKARGLGIRIISFPEYLYEQSKDKRRIVIAGSHGKTTTTAMIMHVFRSLGITFDYMVGSHIDGFDTMVGLSDDSELAVFEGDEYLTSALDKRPKFLLYNPEIAVLNGIAWDHKNVFPTFSNYLDQFRTFVEKIPDKGILIYYEDDAEVKRIASTVKNRIKTIPYRNHSFLQDDTGFYITTCNRKIPMHIFGEHNMQNLSAAKEVCIASGINEEDFYRVIKDFRGTAKRLQKLVENEKGIVYLDFAHSPSKVKATVDAVVLRHPGRPVIACLELHTYSSLSHDFLPQYKGTMNNAAYSFVYFNPHAITMKKLEPLTKEYVEESFQGTNLTVYDSSCELFSDIIDCGFGKPVYLFMSSGDFDGFNLSGILD